MKLAAILCVKVVLIWTGTPVLHDANDGPPIYHCCVRASCVLSITTLPEPLAKMWPLATEMAR